MTSSSGTPDLVALRERIQADFERSGLMLHLGAQLGEVAPGRVHIHLPYAPSLTQHLGYFHAGATTSIADAAGGFAAMTVAPAGHTVLSVEFKINLLAPAEGIHFLARGRVLRAGRRLTVCQADVFALGGAESLLVATMLSTIIVRPRASA
jgi:uncharacterized protein (TIGR00369 family)